MNKIITIVIAIILLASAIVGILIQKPEPLANNPLPKPSINPNIKVETNCTDSIDNDQDGMTDNEDGDCWLREGAVFVEDFEPVRIFKDFADMAPQLKDIGVKTIETLPLWDHPSTGNHGVRWAVRDYSKLDPERGTEADLSEFIKKAHEVGLKVVPYVQITGTFASSPACKDKIIAGNTLFYDKDGKGGALYQYQLANPNKEIILKNVNGQFLCLPTGWGFAVNQDSPDVIELAKEIYATQIVDRGLDGMRLDASGRNHCLEGEKVYLENKKYDCIDPATEKHSPLTLYRELKNLKTPDQVFMAEVQYTEALTSDYMWKYPYYPATPDIDEVAEASEGYEFLSMLRHVKTGEITSSRLVEWVKDQPILYNRQRFRMIRNWNGVDKSVVSFVATDPRYYPAVTMAVTIPGISKVSDYELFGDEYADNYYKIAPTNSPESRKDHWKKVLNLRNSSNSFKYGDIKDIWRSGGKTYAYSRTYQGETAIVIINFSGKTAISVLNLPFKSGIILSDELNNEEFTVSDPSSFKVSVPAYGARILIIKK